MDHIEQENAADLKRKLSRRLLLAAGLIVALLGTLTVFDHLSQLEREDAEMPVAAVQPRVGPSISSPRPEEPAMPAEVPITPSTSLVPKELPPAIEPPPKPEISAQPAASPAKTEVSKPTAPVPPAPVAAPSVSAPLPAVKPVPAPAVAPSKGLAPVAPIAPAATAPVAATSRPGAPAPIPPVAPAATIKAPVVAGTPTASSAPAVSAAPQSGVPVPSQSVSAVPEDSASAPITGLPPSAVRLPAPAARSTAAPASPPPRPVLSRLAAGFVLQAGVFFSTERAEELKAKLVTAGVPVSIESRVQVGPFATQKEADAARKKIREMGIDSIVIPPRAGRR